MIDASIPLQVRPTVQQQDPMEQYSRMLSLKHMQAQEERQRTLDPMIFQQHQLQLSQAQMQQRQMEQDQKDEELGAKAYNEAKGHPENFLKLAGDYGMSQRGLARARQNMAAQQLALVKQHTADTKLQSDQLALTGQRHDKWADNLTAFMKRPDDDSPQGMKANWSNLLESGYRNKLSTDDEHAAALKQYPTFPGREVVEQLRNANASQGWFAKQGTAESQRLTAEKNQQAVDEKKKQDVLGKLQGATSLDQWNKILADNGRDMNEFGPPPFDTQTGEGATERTPDAGAMRRLNRMGMTPTQAAAADAAELRAKELKQREDQAEAHRKTMEGFAANRDKRETALSHKEKIMGLADQAERESKQYGGTTYDHFIANVENPDFYVKHPIGDNRGEVAAELRKRKDAQLNTTGKEIKVDDAAARAKLLEDAGLAPPKPKPATPAKKETKAAPAAAPAAASQVLINRATGHKIVLDPKLNKWVDAQTGEPVQ